MKVVLAFLFLLSIKISFAQIDVQRDAFFNQRLLELKNQYGSQVSLKVSDNRLPWDTTDYVFTRFFTRYDTTDSTDLGVKSKSVKRKIIQMMKELNEQDYHLIRQQIRNQFTDSFIKESIIST